VNYAPNMLRYLYHSQLCTRKALDMLQSHSQYRFLFLTITPYNQVLDKWQQILLLAGIMYLVNVALNFFCKSSTLAPNNPPLNIHKTHAHRNKSEEKTIQMHIQPIFRVQNLKIYEPIDLRWYTIFIFAS
jgi:hypothetical protein